MIEATGDDRGEKPLVTLSAPAVWFAVRLTTVGVVLVLYMLILDDMARGRFVPAACVILGVYGSIVVWGYRHGLGTILTTTTVRVIRQFGGFRSVVDVPLEEIEDTNLPPYSGRLVAVLRDGRSVVLANKHSVSKEPLPDVEFPAEVPHGPVRTLLRFKHAVDQSRRQVVSRRRASRGPSEPDDA